MDQGNNSGGDEEIEDSGYILSGMLTGFAGGLHIGCVSKKGIKGYAKVLGLNNWKERFAVNGG